MMKRYSANQAYLEDHLHRMHHDIEIVTRKLELEKRRAAKLDQERRRAQQDYDSKVLPPKKKQRAQTPRSNRAVSAPMKVLENRLEANLKQLDMARHESEVLRTQIDQVRKERLQMNVGFKKLVDEIKTSERCISGLRQEEDAARDISDDAGRRINAMKKKLESERTAFKQDVVRLNEEMKHQDRGKKEWEVRLYKEQYGRGAKNTYLVADEESDFSERSLMKRILKLAFLNCIQRRHIKQHQKNIEVFEQAFATIKSTTGISDIEEIVKIFVKLEERNFSLLTYVNQLNREMESLEKQNRDNVLKQRAMGADKEAMKVRRNAAVAELETQLKDAQAQVKDNMESYNVHQDIQKEVKPIIFEVARRLEKETKGAAVCPTEDSDDHMLEWLMYIEKTLSQWREFLPEARVEKRDPGFKPFAYTVGPAVKQLPPKRTHAAPGPLVKQGELPVAQLEEKKMPAGQQARMENDEESDEEDYGERPWNMQELREKSLNSLLKRRRLRQGRGGQGEEKAQAGESGSARPGRDGQVAGAKEDKEEREVGYTEMVEKIKEDDDSASDASDGDRDDGAEPTDDELNEIFLKRYKMSKEELQAMADKMGIQLNNLCYLKQEFDAYDEDRSGYIDVKELRELLHKLGEELTEEELEQAFRELDQDGSGEIEFFEFVEWFTSED